MFRPDIKRASGLLSGTSCVTPATLFPVCLARYSQGHDARKCPIVSTPQLVSYRISSRCSSTSSRTRNIPDGLLSREGDSSSVSLTAQAAGRSVAEGLLSQEVCSSSEGSGFAQAAGRSVPEGLLSREDGSSSDGSITKAVGRIVPEGLLSREEGSSSDGSITQAAGRIVPEGLLSREDGSSSDGCIMQAAGRSVPEGLLSREGDSSVSEGTIVQADGRSVGEGLLSREDGSSSEGSGFAQAAGRIVPEGLLSREDGSSSDGSITQAAGRIVPEGLLSREDGSSWGRSITQAAGRSVPEGLLSREDGSSNSGSSIAQATGGSVPEGLHSREDSGSTERGPGSRQFNWFQQWYPVASLDALDPSRPHAFTLLGQDLVLWRDGSGSWRAFKDACPHRLAPLSEGRIEKDGTLMCAYHAWRFDGSGACAALPYCSPDDPALRSPRSCAVSYPTLQRGGVLWVWAEGGPAAAAAAAARQPPLPPEVQDDGSPAPGVTCLGWSHRDLPYSHAFFVENVVDPAHVPVSHHNIAGNRYKDPKPFHVEIVRPPSLEEGFKMCLPNMESASVRDSYTEFVPPSLVRIQSENRDGSRTVLALFSTPIRPGWTRLVGQQIMIEAPGGASRGRSIVGFVGSAMPQWLSHALAPFFLHQDMVFLHRQDREVTRQQQQAVGAAAPPSGPGLAGPSGYSAEGASASRSPVLNKYYMPGQADKGVAAWRTWLSTFGGGDVSYAAGTPPLGPVETDRSVLFDTWNTHTRNCTICLAALGRIRAARAVAAAVGLAAAGLAFGAVVTRAAAAASVAAATAAAAAATPSAGAAAAASGAAGGSGVFTLVLQSAVSLLGSWEGLAAVAVGALAAAVVAVSNKLEQLMHKHEFSHADNH